MYVHIGREKNLPTAREWLVKISGGEGGGKPIDRDALFKDYASRDIRLRETVLLGNK